MWNLLSRLLLFLAIYERRTPCSAQDVGETEIVTTRACENAAFLLIKCPNEQQVINVTHAIWGRTSNRFCPDPNNMRVTDCVFESSLQVVQKSCQGENSCIVFTSIVVFNPDPCPDVRKYLEVNYICGIPDALECSSPNSCNETTEKCLILNGGSVCECAENYQRNKDGSCQAITCENSGMRCTTVTQRCEDMNPGVYCVCAEGYVRDEAMDECIVATCQNSPNYCNSTTEMCEDSNGIHCACVENYSRDKNNECVEITCENFGMRCTAVTQRCEDLNPGIRCICAEGYVRDEVTNDCTAITCENSGIRCRAVTQRCEDMNPGIRCVCAEGFVEDEVTGECSEATCKNSPNYCNSTTEMCEDRNGIHCACAGNYTRDQNNECVAITCENSGMRCTTVTQRCIDMNPGIQCICAEGYFRDEVTSACTAITCENSGMRCTAVTQRCEDMNPGIRCVCAEGYVKDIGTDECTAATCQNFPNYCNKTTEMCEDRDEIHCTCAENYFRDQNNECVAITCDNSGMRCTTVTQRCEDMNPGIQCVCAEGYIRDKVTSECTAISCENSGMRCTTVTQRCEDTNPGIRCVCAEGYIRDEVTSDCIAATCKNSPDYCNSTTERCEENNGIHCACAENYTRDQNSGCVAITCQSAAKGCNKVTERCQDLHPGMQCICAEGYARDGSNECAETNQGVVTTPWYDSTTVSTTTNPLTSCSADVISIGGVTLSFPATETGEEVASHQTCIQELQRNQTNQTRPFATRVCNQVWQEPELQNCFNVDTHEEQLTLLLQLNITTANVQQIAQTLSLLTYEVENVSANILDLIVECLAQIVKLGSSSFEVTDAVIGVVSAIMQIEETVLLESEEVSLVVPLMEEQITNVQRNKQNYSQNFQNLNIRAIKVQKSSFRGGFTLMDHPADTGSDINNDDEPRTESSITLPYSVVEVVNNVYSSVTALAVSFVIFRDSRLFRTRGDDSLDGRNITNGYVGSNVISSTVELPNVTISGLPQNSSVMINFTDVIYDEMLNDAKTEVLCVYWKYTSEKGEGEWSKDGCRKVSSGLTDVTCSCDHLTSFAVLVRTYEEKEDKPVHLVLQLITTIGCIISIIGLFLSLLCMVIIRKVRNKQQTHVHMNLCFALLGLYLSFLFGIGLADQPEVCRRMTSVIYFFCLASMAWMSVEAFYIYVLIWKSKRHNIKHLIPVGVLFAWGFPGIAAVVIYFLDTTHDYEGDPDYCFLHPGYILLYGFLLELLILFLYNSIVFVLVTYRVSCRKIQLFNKDDRRQEKIIRLKSTLLFWLLLGISWIFGFFATFEQPASIVFQIIFCVLLSLQGFFMFYMLVVQNPEIKKGISSASSFRSQSASIQLGTRTSTASTIKKQSRQESSPRPSFDHTYDHNVYI